MAKKITKEEYEKKKQKEKQKPKKKDVLKIVSIVLNIVLIIALIVTIIISIYNYNVLQEENYTLYDEIDSKIKTIDKLESDIDGLTDGKGIYATKEKMKFYDKSVVFVIEGYGNYYYTYDCMMKKVGNKAFSYWVYSDVSAKSEGFKKGSC